ncbi:MAG: hypothetical protein ACI9NY_001857, partial [Kiritimatiellia bacterium]
MDLALLLTINAQVISHHRPPPFLINQLLVD